MMMINKQHAKEGTFEHGVCEEEDGKWSGGVLLVEAKDGVCMYYKYGVMQSEGGCVDCFKCDLKKISIKSIHWMIFER